MSKHSRTPLAQGILSETSQSSFHRSYESPLPARNVFSPLLSSKHDISDDDDDDDNEQGTPRQNTPTKTKPSSRPKSVTELSLSDVDGDHMLRDSIERSKRRLPEVTTAVLVVETDKTGVESGEVETRSFTVQSPAKVVCHSPGRDGKVKKSRHKKLSESSLTEDGKKTSFSTKDLSMDGITKTKSVGGPLKESRGVSASQSVKESTGVKKKKKFVPVQSRYKQLPAKKDDVKSRSLELSAITPHPSVQPPSGGQRKSSRVTSTPFLMTSMYEGHQPTDGSILDQTRFQASEPLVKEPMMKKTKAKHLKDNVKKRDTSKETAKDGKTGTEVDQLTLDLHYARLLQLTYLKMKALQTFESQEEKAKSDIYGLWMMNRKLEKEIEALNLAIKTQKLEMAIDQLLNVQLEGFKPLSGKLSKLILKSSRLGEAIANTNHYLPLSDIKLEDEEKLFVALDESKRLLAEIRSLTRRNQPEIEQLSSATEVLMKTVNSEVQEQKKCSELLAACATLTNQERSLQVQILQDS